MYSLKYNLFSAKNFFPHFYFSLYKSINSSSRLSIEILLDDFWLQGSGQLVFALFGFFFFSSIGDRAFLHLFFFLILSVEKKARMFFVEAFVFLVLFGSCQGKVLFLGVRFKLIIIKCKLFRMATAIKPKS